MRRPQALQVRPNLLGPNRRTDVRLEHQAGACGNPVSETKNGGTQMGAARTATAFGRIFPPRDAWLAKAPPEPIIDPDLPIIDTHHHLWHRTASTRGESWEVPAFRYLIDEFVADCATGHNIVGSVFLQCHSMYRTGGPSPMRPVGETEFVAGIAAMSDSGGYGKTRIAAGIVGYADLTIGDWVDASAGGAYPSRRRTVSRRCVTRLVMTLIR